MKPENTDIQSHRVQNGWIITGMTYAMRRDGGYMPDQTAVAETPEKLGQLLGDWARAQESLPRPL